MKLTLVKQESPIFLIGAVSGVVAFGMTSLFFGDFVHTISRGTPRLLMPGALFGVCVFGLSVWRGFGLRGLWWVPASSVSFLMAWFCGMSLQDGLRTILSTELHTFLAFGCAGVAGALVLLLAGRLLVGPVSFLTGLWALIIAYIVPSSVVLFLEIDMLIPGMSFDPYLLLTMILYQSCALVAIDLLLKHHDYQH